ncbi:MAG: class I SAM-dependent methyltransferase [Candidatus Coatesbacteria bacterium]|nr:MAG: class I SAM-dependent methyltransferase [Candidatus Coatesbacteria bacterium]
MNGLVTRIIKNPKYAANKAAAVIEAAVFRVRELLGARGGTECPVCGWRGFDFRSFTSPGVMYRRRRAVCPRCGSLGRHRALAVLLDKLGVSGPVLSISPIPGLHPFLEKRGIRLTVLDISPGRADIIGDVTALPFASGTWSVVICLHVLEHVRDDETAVREIHRSLAVGGHAVVQVPYDPDLAETVEYTEPDPLEEGHLRTYGADYAERLTAGLSSEKTDVQSNLTPEEVRLYGIRDAEFLVVEK